MNFVLLFVFFYGPLNWIYIEFRHMRLSAFKKAVNFWLHYCVLEMFFPLAKKNAVESLNFETKIVDNILKQILHTRSLIRPPDNSINQQNND